MKKIIYKILVISLFINAIFSIKSFATSDFSYTIDANGNATITAYNGTESNLTIPSTVDSHKVIAIGSHALDESHNSTNGHTIKNVEISEGIERIELLAFAKCANLETVRLPETLTFLDMQTFIQCGKLKSINIPSKITCIGNSVFQETGFTEFDIPENVKSIDTRALGICSSLEKVRVYSKDISYASGVFEYGSSNLVLYGYEGSTTQTYAKQNGIQFKNLSSGGQEEIITNDFELKSYGLSNGEFQYGVYVKKDNEDALLSIKAKDYNLPSNLYDYKDNIRLRITYSKVDDKVLDCKVVNYKTGEIIENLSEENINKLFNIEYGKTVNKKNWVDVIKLSELKENEIYKYTANATIQFPKIENDIRKNCVIYIKENDEKTYEQKISMHKEISGNSISISFNEYNSGESFCIMYEKIENDELLRKIQEDEIICLSKYKDGDKLEYSFEKYIYNDTTKNITINIKDAAFGIEYSNSITMSKGEIYGFDWMIDSAVIKYENEVVKPVEKEDSTKETQKDTSVKNNTKETPKDTTVKNDTTVATEKLPKTGVSITIIFVIISTIAIGIVFYKKYSNYKDIK